MSTEPMVYGCSQLEASKQPLWIMQLEILISTDQLILVNCLLPRTDIELRGTDPRIDFWNPTPAMTGASIIYDENSNSGGNGGDLEFVNYQVAGEIEFYTSTSNF